ncbi:hypothetical protein FBD94_18165 [Pedobacter hiemivivus]|uniref:Uncharacterized protein n=1 Tax=Pedobacter hiemivivus TaxID=2530454 RepID=A0A4U1G4D9_9SPHI|nr:hypothetical protein [Pedobacter hiemivivus]TKC58541.1 hypothetical protein FBD94_18165 [Pedobacter hiemivivus]
MQLIFTLFANDVVAQYKDIFLMTSQTPDKRQKNLIIKNKADTAFLSIKYYEDMGRRYGAHYEFNKKLPDGDYQVYIDSVLRESATFLNGVRNGSSNMHYPNGEYLITPYVNGKIEGTVRRYISKILFSEAFFVKSKCMVRIVYNRDGTVNNNEFYINSTLVRNESLDSNSKIKKIVDYKILTGNSEFGLKGSELNGEEKYGYKEGTFIVLYQKSKIISWKWLQNEQNPPVVFYHKMVSLRGHIGSAALLFQSLSKSDDAFFEFTDKKDIGFYIDTLSHDLFYNNYVVGEETVDTVHKTNFNKIYDVGKLNLRKGYLNITKQRVTNETFDGFFVNKVNLSNLNKNVLLSLTEFSDNVHEKVSPGTKSYTQSFLIDLNADGTKEKLVITVRFDMDTPFEHRALSELEFKFSRYERNNWLLYDSINLKNELERDIDQITVFRQERNSFPNIYINSSSTNMNGKVLQDQVLLLGSTDTEEVKITK